MQRLINVSISSDTIALIDSVEGQSWYRTLVYTLEANEDGYCVYGIAYRCDSQTGRQDSVLSQRSALSETSRSKEHLHDWMIDYVRQKTVELVAYYRTMGNMVRQTSIC